MKINLLHGDNRETLKTLPDNSIDAIVTDGPYGINFLDKDWDANTGALETYQECLRVLKPGGHILAFSAARTYHYLAVTLEQAGFEIRDQIMWIYSTGFPKAQDVGKNIDKRAGVKTVKKTYLPDRDVEKYGPGVDAAKAQGTRKCVLCDSSKGYVAKTCPREDCIRPWEDTANNEWAGWKTALKPAHEPIALARKPMKGSTVDNVLEHGTGALNIDGSRIGDESPIHKAATNTYHKAQKDNDQGTYEKNAEWSVIDNPNVGRYPSNVIGEIPDYQKYFYQPKVSRAERHVGFDQDLMKGVSSNNHPTVKPVALMRYLIKLVTPPGGIVLDPFCGSGSTGMAAVELGYEFIGCELDADYVQIAQTRIEAWYQETRPKNNFNDHFDE